MKWSEFQTAVNSNQPNIPANADVIFINLSITQDVDPADTIVAVTFPTDALGSMGQSAFRTATAKENEAKKNEAKK